jgi:hypothetical protein
LLLHGNNARPPRRDEDEMEAAAAARRLLPPARKAALRALVRDANVKVRARATDRLLSSSSRLLSSSVCHRPSFHKPPHCGELALLKKRRAALAPSGDWSALQPLEEAVAATAAWLSELKKARGQT